MENGFLFTRPLEYEIKDNGDLEVSGNISTTHPDLVNDIVSLACLKSMQKQIQEGNLKIDLEHEAFRGKDNEEKEINKTRIPVGRMIEPTITESKTDKGIMHGLSVKVLFNKAAKTYEATKSNIVNKFLDAFSIAYIPTKSRAIMKGKEQFRVLEDLRLLNTALTGNPVNTTAQMTQIITKSIDALEEYKAEKKINPELGEMLEVKTSDASRQARNDAISGGDEEEDEETKKKKKEGKKKYPSKKAYEKDGAHAHTESEPLGLHNHPEIEERVMALAEFIFKEHDSGPVDTSEEKSKRLNELKNIIEVRSHSNENLQSTEKEVKMTEENENAVVSEAEKAPEKAPEANEANASAEPLSEVKSLIESGFKSMNERLSKLEAKDKEAVAPKKEAKSKVLGAENSDSQNLKAEGKAVAGGLSMIC